MNIHVHIPTQSTYHSDMLMNSNFFLLKKKVYTHNIRSNLGSKKRLSSVLINFYYSLKINPVEKFFIVKTLVIR